MPTTSPLGNAQLFNDIVGLPPQQIKGGCQCFKKYKALPCNSLISNRPHNNYKQTWKVYRPNLVCQVHQYDILDIFRIEAGRITIEASPFNLRHGVGETIDILSSQAQEKGLRSSPSRRTAPPNGKKVLKKINSVESGGKGKKRRYASKDT